MEQDLSYVKAIITRQGHKLTNQKIEILKIIIQNNSHMTAKEIYEQAKGKHIGLATIYRNLKFFKEIGIIKEIVVKEKTYYEMKLYSKKPLHIHFECYKCNDIIDIDDRDAVYDYLKISQKVGEKYNMCFYDANIMLFGLCEKCREGKNAETNKM